MEGGAAAAMEVLVKSVIHVLAEEISRVQGLDQDAQQLKANLEIVQSYLNDAEKKEIDPVVKTWLQNLEKVAFEADNVLDEFKYHTLHKEMKAMKTTMNNAISCLPSFHHTLRPRQMAIRIKEINTSFDSINKMATDLGLHRKLVDAPSAVSVAAFETDSFTHDPIFIGRDDDVPKLVEVMTGRPEEKISILAVVGMGGMGKTTLTRNVFNHQKIKTQFGFQSWVHVSQTFDPIIIFKKFLASLLSQIVEDKSRERVPKEHNDEPIGRREVISVNLQKSFKGETDEDESREGILKKIQEALKAKTYLLVLDDIWNEDLLKWTNFINSLLGVSTMKGNGIIITTRSEKVASIVDPLETHRLNGLSDDDCWSIIKKMSIPSEFETIGRKIAKRCQGLPLAAKVVGGVLRHKTEEEWLSIEQKWLSDDEGNNISGILRLSYDNLSSPELKKCFAYCSIFAKGHRMVKQELIQLWMAEGFLQLGGTSDMESAGNNFINVLLNNSLLQVVPRNDDEDEEICVMHDLVHDLASSVLGSLKSRYVRHEGKSSCISKESAKYLRTLFLEGTLSKLKFSDFKCLHVLKFGSGSGKMMYETKLVRELGWSSIGKLIHLRKLDFSKTKIGYLPDSISELHHLQTLRADTQSLKKLPRTLTYLISLRHLYLYFSNGDFVIKLPPKIGRLTSLQTLTHFTVGHENGCQIQELGSLKNLKGKLSILNLENVQGKGNEEAKKANIFHNPNLVELTFQWKEESENEENVLEGLQPHPYLKKLRIIGFQGTRFPLWTLKMAVRDEPQGSWVQLNKLVEITLSKCMKCEEIPALGHLPNLKHLCLRELTNVKYINSSFYGIDGIGVCQETIVVFPALERLELRGLNNVKEWGEPESRRHGVKVFPSLTELEIIGLHELECLPNWVFHSSQNLSRFMIKYCPKLRGLPDGLHTLNSLQELTIYDCPNLKSIGNPSESEGQSQGTKMSLTVLQLTYLYILECLPYWMNFHNHQNLSMIQIWSCLQLRELPDGLDTLISLQEFTIFNCPNLKSIGNPSGSKGRSRGTLRRLRIIDCQELIVLPLEMLELWAPSLETMTLHGLYSLKNLPNVIECLAKSDRLTNLEIAGVPKFMVTCGVGSWPFHSLRELKIDASVEWSRESSAAIKETVDGILGACSQSLDELQLTGLDIWDSLPESIQILTGLTSLSLRNFGIQELPECLGNLTKLEYLKVQDCPKLRIDLKWLRNNINPKLYVEVDGHKIQLFSEICFLKTMEVACTPCILGVLMYELCAA